jgi:hypothetical protein
VASLSNLIERVRFELGDLGKSFVTQFVADGTTNRFKLHYAPLDAAAIVVLKNNVDISLESSIEESTGVLVTDTLPDEGDEFTVSGNYYRYFTASELGQLITVAAAQHGAKHTDALGRQISLENLPSIEEYPVVIYAVSLALFTLATDSAFDIDIQAPDGVTIPRAQRYRQLMEMVQTRKDQYKELCVHLGIGMFSIDVFTLRRISKMTNRYVPVYSPQEVDDKSWLNRVQLPLPQYGDKPTEWPTEGEELTAYQGRDFTTQIILPNEYEDASLVAKLLIQRGAIQVVKTFDLSVTTTNGVTTATLSLDREDTLYLASRTWYSIQLEEENEDKPLEIIGGRFFTTRVSEVRL